ncbi:MAG: hypothetical protein KF862_03530 [Chitinophagaceae bacterium]|nr:hypothetical protein [Chitinophagaceae bacterium]
MKKTFFSIFFVMIFLSAGAQEDHSLENIADSVVADARLLYRSEMASWYGTDVFMERAKDKERAKGYFSYSIPGMVRCIFFTADEIPKVIAAIDFDSTYNVNTAVADFKERNFTETEQEIFAFRSKALDVINSDTFFLHYKNTNYNIIPVIMNGEKRVYVLTGTTQNGEVIFGNDYLLCFDAQNNLTCKKRLHNSIIRTNFGKQADGQEIVGGMHSHVIDDFITPTDICTLMLYNPLMKWTQYTVMSKKFFSIWNCRTNQLVILTKEVIERINKDQKKRKKKDRNKND